MRLEGEVGELDLIRQLVDFGSEKFTGALRFENEAIIKIIYFKGGDILTASTNDRSDSIDEILLRSGKVTREHVRQALSKRKEGETLGDALLGLGFIARKELVWARRAQLIGILRSILKWDGGSYTIVADYLPKRDDGTPFPYTQVILELILTDPDRERYDEVLLQGEAVLRRTAEFEQSYPTLGLNREADEIVALLDGGSSAAEVAAQSKSDEFNVYKLLFALETLGVLERSIEPNPTLEVSMASFELDPPAPPVPDPPAWEEGPAPGEWDVLTGAPTITAPLVTEDLLQEAAGDRALVRPEWERTELPEPPVSVPPPAVPPATSPSAVAGETTATRRRGGYAAAPPRKRGRFLWVAVLLAVVGAAGAAAWWYGTSQRNGLLAGFAPEAAVSAPEPAPVQTAPPLAVEQVEPQPVAAATAPELDGSLVGAAVAPPGSTGTAVEPAAASAGGGPGGVAAAQPPPAVPPPTPTPAVAPARAAEGDSLRPRYDEMAAKYATEAASVPYTIQFALVCQTSSVSKSIAEGGGKVWFIPIQYRGEACYRMFWGRYGSEAEAEAGKGEIPQSLRGSRPVALRPGA